MGLTFAPEVQDYVRTLAPAVKREIRATLDKIRDDPRHPDLDVKTLRKEGRYLFLRARVRAYRIVYSPTGAVTYVWRIFHRSEGYGWLDRLDP